MHAVHVIARLNDGGPVRVLAALLPALAGLGWRSTVLCGQVGAEERDATGLLADQGIAVERIPGLGRRLSLGEDLRAFRAVRHRLRDLGPDLVHTHTAKAGILGRLAARSLGLPVVHTYHGHVLDGYFPRLGTVAAALLERTCARGSALHALTPSQARDLHHRHRIGRAGRWSVLPIPVAIPERQPSAPRPVPVLGFLGRLVDIKDPLRWLRVLAELNRREPWCGRICGDGPLRAAVAEAVRAAGLDVEVCGFVSPAEALAGMDVLLLTSRNEGLPVAAIEAAGLGIPVVATAVGGLRDLARQGLVRGVRGGDADLAVAVIHAHRCGPLVPTATVAAAYAPASLARRYAALYGGVYAGYARAHGRPPRDPRPRL